MQQKQRSSEPAGPLDSGRHHFQPAGGHEAVSQEPPQGPDPSGAVEGRSTHGTRPVLVAGPPGQHPEPPPEPGPAWAPAPLASISRPRPTTLGAKAKLCRGPEGRSREKDPCSPLCITVPQGAKCLSLSPTSESSWSQHSPHSPRSPQTCTTNHQPSLPPLPHPRSSPGNGPGPQPDSKTPGGTTPDQGSKIAGETNDFKVYIVTWNVGSAVPPDDITSLFGRDVVDGTIDMFIIGLQEVNSMINKRLKDALFIDQWSELFMDTLGPFGYVLVASQRMQGVLLLAFSKFSHLPFLRDVQTESTRTGLGGCWGNKGGVSVRMTMFGHPVCFLNCHLPAHMRNLDQRMEDFESILQQQQFEGGTATGVLDHDVVFWFGDLNFRIEDYDIHVVKCAVDSHKLPLLWERDQLNMAKNTALILDGFTEGPLNFPPTYKFDVGTHTYDTSAKKRKPAWTDRILWRLRRTGTSVPNHNAALRRGLTSWLGGTTKVTQHEYRSHMDYTASDHKPVSAIFSLHFPFKVDIPLVELQVEKEWCNISDATVRFSVASSYQRSSWDWVALYKVGFKHHKDYVAFIWAKGEHVEFSVDFLPSFHQVTFTEEDIPREDGEYILGYYSNNMNTIVGVAGPIQIRVPVHSPTAGRSESSDVSSEDDSTLVLLSVSSRSPSPKTGGKHHHQRRSSRRSRSPAVPSNPLPSLQGLGLSPRPKDSPTGSRSPGSAGKKERLVSPDTLPSPSLSPLSPRSPISPRSPGGTVTVPEALVAAILGEHRPGPAASPLGGGSKRTGKHTHGDAGV
ncbi:unnamed protein product [Lota lota]